MRTMPLALAATLVFATASLAACNSATPAPEAPTTGAATGRPSSVAPTPMASECKAEAAEQFVGQKATPEVIEAARVAAGATVARALRPDMAITLEYRGDRLNLRTNTSDVVESVGCG